MNYEQKAFLESNSLGNSPSKISLHMENRTCDLIYARQERQHSALIWKKQFSRRVGRICFKLHGVKYRCSELMMPYKGFFRAVDVLWHRQRETCQPQNPPSPGSCTYYPNIISMYEELFPLCARLTSLVSVEMHFGAYLWPSVRREFKLVLALDGGASFVHCCLIQQVHRWALNLVLKGVVSILMWDTSRRFLINFRTNFIYIYIYIYIYITFMYPRIVNKIVIDDQQDTTILFCLFIPNQLYMFRTMFSPIFRSTWLYVM